MSSRKMKVRKISSASRKGDVKMAKEKPIVKKESELQETLGTIMERLEIDPKTQGGKLALRDLGRIVEESRSKIERDEVQGILLELMYDKGQLIEIEGAPVDRPYDRDDKEQEKLSILDTIHSFIDENISLSGNTAITPDFIHYWDIHTGKVYRIWREENPITHEFDLKMEEVKTTKEGEVETGLPGIVDKIMDYEHGNMSEEEMIDFFQKMLDSGLVWQLQGHYHRTAQALLEAGLIKRRTKEAKGESPPIMKFRNIEEGEN